MVRSENQRRVPARRIALAAGIFVSLTLAGAAYAAEVGSPGKKLIISTNTVSGKHKIVSLQKSALINPGAPGSAALLSGSFQVFYVDDPVGHNGVLSLPAPWLTAGPAFKFKNNLAPGGPSPVKAATIKSGKLAKLTAKGLGGLDISTAPGAGGVVSVFTVDNGNDASQLKVCSRYSVADGSTVTHKTTANGFKLILKNGIPVTCPGCSDGITNGNETDTDCGGGTCADCGPGDTCLLPSDCDSGVCTGNVCQAPTCSDGVKNQGESDVDCGGPCAGCGFNGDCVINSDCGAGLSCVGLSCKCNNAPFTFTVNSNSGGAFDSAEWPGGTTSQSSGSGCGVTINRPNNNIDLVCSLAAPFSVNSFSGFSNCFGTGGEDGDGCNPSSCPFAGIGSCCQGRPSCSVATNGSGSAQYFVQCLQ